MKKRIAWLVVSCLMVVSLVLASCAPKVTEEKKTVTEEKKTVTEEKKTVAVKEVPRYGGALNVVESRDPPDMFSYSTILARGYAGKWHLYVTNEMLVLKDPLRGPGGTGELSMLYQMFTPPEKYVGNLAESFEIIQPDTIKVKIRKGVRWHDKAPTYGAELTPEDVVNSYVVSMARPGSAIATTYPYLSDMKNPEKSVYVDPGDPQTVVFKLAQQPGYMSLWWDFFTAWPIFFPKALGDMKGEGFVDWKGVVGTGPLVLTDYVAGSSLTYQRNPNYWQKDPFYPQNQLPYVDRLKILIIPDVSTQMAAMRTGKIDVNINTTSNPVDAEDMEALLKTNPELQSVEVLGSFDGLSMRHDRKPWDDVRVRRAMQMAINRDELVNDYYKGKGVKLYWPAFPIPDQMELYTPLEQMPPEVQELFGYHPDKAKQLLAEAGYPKGFDTSIIVSSSEEKSIDLLAIVKSYWAKVGVNLNIDVKEPAVFTSMQRAFTYEQGIWQGAGTWEPFKFQYQQPGALQNQARVNDPVMNAHITAITEAVSAFNSAEIVRLTKKAAPELIMLVPQILLPAVPGYNVWQPWVKGYHGETNLGYTGAFRWLAAGGFAWIDQDLKQQMTGRK